MEGRVKGVQEGFNEDGGGGDDDDDSDVSDDIRLGSNLGAKY